MSSDGHRARRSFTPQVDDERPKPSFMRTSMGYGQVSAQPNGPAAGVRREKSVGHRQGGGMPTSVLTPVTEAQSLLRGKLRVIQGEQRGETWFLNRTHTSMGRALDNDMILLDIAASRKHAQIVRQSDRFMLHDLRSANGVFLNGRRISEEELFDGDEIEIGETILVYETVGEPRVRFIDDEQTAPGMDELPVSFDNDLHQESGTSQRHPLPEIPQNTPQPIQLPPVPPLPSLSRADVSRDGEQRHFQPLVGQDEVSPLSRMPSTSSEPQKTYGFGSQLSPDELRLTIEERGFQQSYQQRQTPFSWMRWWSQVRDRYLDQWISEVRFSQSRKARVIRSTLLTGGALFFFILGQALNQIGDRLSDPRESGVELESGVMTPLSAPQSDPSSTTTSSSSDQSNQRLKALIDQRSWSEALKLVAQEEKAGRAGPDMMGVKISAEEGLLAEQVPAIEKQVQRGQLKVAITQFKRMESLVSSDAQLRVLHLKYCLWVYQHRLPQAASLNPPPREQRILGDAAELALSGKKTQAQRVLSKVKPGRGRLELFNLRKKGLKQQGAKAIERLELSSLLCQTFDTQRYLQRYRVAIEDGVRKTQYRQVAAWIEGALTLAVGDPRVYRYLASTKDRLKSEARSWLRLAKQGWSTDPLQARALVDASLPYLTGKDREDALDLEKRLKRSK